VEVTPTTIETNASTGEYREGEIKQKPGNSSALVAQSTLMIKKRTLSNCY
jgi:hypothetical protein